MTALPTGTVTFLFTDIEGSTRLFQQDPETMKVRSRAIMRSLQGAIGAHRGQVFHVLGDGFCSAFEDAGEALQAALEAQRALHPRDWGDARRRFACAWACIPEARRRTTATTSPR